MIRFFICLWRFISQIAEQYDLDNNSMQSRGVCTYVLMDRRRTFAKKNKTDSQNFTRNLEITEVHNKKFVTTTPSRYGILSGVGQCGSWRTHPHCWISLQPTLMIISWRRNRREWLGNDSQCVDLGVKLRDLDYILQTATTDERGFVGDVRQKRVLQTRKCVCVRLCDIRACV